MAGLLEGIDLRTQMAGQNRLELLLFRLGGKQRFGINVFKVQEVIQSPPLTQVPGSHMVVRGIANMRGKTIPVMDLSMAIGSTPMQAGDGRFVIITEYNKQVQGFLVGSVDRIINLRWEEIKPPPKGGSGAYMTAVTQVDNELVEIIDVEKVLAEVVGSAEIVSANVAEHELDYSQDHVLVVDDSLVARKQVEHVLKQLGISFTSKNNGLEALGYLQQLAREKEAEGLKASSALSLVISDIEMPSMDGYSLTAAIRKDPTLADLYVVLHSSLSGVFNENMIKKVGANRFIPKYDPDQLANLIKEFIDEYHACHS